ncbi:MAG: hypothetical protein ACU0BS_08555 [Hasllibacter sp.]
MRAIALIAALAAAPALAAGGDQPPAPTPTTTECPEGTVWDAEAEGCVAPERSSLDADALYRAVRELAHAGRLDGAAGALDAMPDQSEARVLTYRGFIARQRGDLQAAGAHYAAAIAADPAGILARSYWGQGLAMAGRHDEARALLREIRALGGRETWAEFALEQAIATGRGASY